MAGFGGSPIRNRPIAVPKAPSRASLLTVRCDLRGAEPPIWRRLEIHGDLTLDAVHDVIMAAMGWSGGHLHRFLGPGSDPRRSYFLTEFDVSEGDEGTEECAVRLDQVLCKPKDRIVHEYDFGDAWEHVIVLEKVSALPDGAPEAVVTAGRGACPPEDVGGIRTWNELAELLRRDPDPRRMADHEHFEMYADWLPPGLDPDHFSTEEANEAIELIDADLATLLAKVEGLDSTPPPGPALEALFDLALPADMVELSSLCARAWKLASPIDTSRIAAVLEPWQVLLEAARPDGIALTSAGWMKPGVCEHLWMAGGLHRSGIGKGNREQHTSELRELRESAIQMKLLRKHKGHLVLTPLGRRAVGDADLLLRTVAGQYVDHGSPAQTVEATLALLLVAATPEHDVSTHRDRWEFTSVIRAAVAQWMGRVGWSRSDGGPVTSADLWVTHRAVERLGLERWTEHPDLATARSLARRVLWGRQ